MSKLYLLQNQHGYFFGKNQEWLDGQDPSALFRTPHKDEAINMLFEANTKSVELRINVLEYPINSKKHPIIPTDDLPPPLPRETPPEDNQESSNSEDLLTNNELARAVSEQTTANTREESL